MKKFLFLTLFLSIGLLWTGCGKDDDAEPSGGSTSITIFEITAPFQAVGVISGTNVTVDYPFGEDISAVTVDATLPAGATITPSNPVDFSNGPVTFTVTNGSSSTSYTVTMNEGENPLRIVLVGDGPMADLPAESKVAYDWAIGEYNTEVAYFSFSDLTADAISTANVIWYHYVSDPGVDMDGNPAAPQDANGDGIYQASEVLPASAANAAGLMEDFVKAGKNIVLSGSTSTLVGAMGRIDEQYNPNNWWYNAGDPVENPDCWGISFLPDTGPSAGDYPADNGSFWLWNGLERTAYSFAEGDLDGICLSPGGMKKDRQNNWFFIPMFEGQVDPDILNSSKDMFEEVTSSTVRASTEWDALVGGIEFGVIVEFGPTGDYEGTVLSVPVGAYEWDRTGGDGPISNVVDLTRNALDRFKN